MKQKPVPTDGFAESLLAASAAVARVSDVTEPSKVSADREARVDELRRQYRNGTYQVDAAEVARKIIGDSVARYSGHKPPRTEPEA
jgi:anti-sigma28 factor (negative regulator of flagellin synthesis)